MRSAGCQSQSDKNRPTVASQGVILGLVALAAHGVETLGARGPLPITWPLKRSTGGAAANRVSSRALRSSSGSREISSPLRCRSNAQCCGGNVRILRRPVETVARQMRGRAAGIPGVNAKAIELYFMRPIVAGGNLRHQLIEFLLDPARRKLSDHIPRGDRDSKLHVTHDATLPGMPIQVGPRRIRSSSPCPLLTATTRVSARAWVLTPLLPDVIRRGRFDPSAGSIGVQDFSRLRRMRVIDPLNARFGRGDGVGRTAESVGEGRGQTRCGRFTLTPGLRDS